jgi:hypothetical protein
LVSTVVNVVYTNLNQFDIAWDSMAMRYEGSTSAGAVVEDVSTSTTTTAVDRSNQGFFSRLLRYFF